MHKQSITSKFKDFKCLFMLGLGAQTRLSDDLSLWSGVEGIEKAVNEVTMLTTAFHFKQFFTEKRLHRAVWMDGEETGRAHLLNKVYFPFMRHLKAVSKGALKLM